jgi:hypothetical protein
MKMPLAQLQWFISYKPSNRKSKTSVMRPNLVLRSTKNHLNKSPICFEYLLPHILKHKTLSSSVILCGCETRVLTPLREEHSQGV